MVRFKLPFGQFFLWMPDLVMNGAAQEVSGIVFGCSANIESWPVFANSW
jgi:hypothetical protein